MACGQGEKEINHQVQAWFSINNTLHLTDKWGLIADAHIRRNNFISDPSFYFLRFGANYWFRDNFTAAVGYAHMWVAPAFPQWETWSNENRIYQQLLWSTPLGKTGMTQRIRNEQRWQQKIVNDAWTGDWRFTNRVRYLLSFNFPITRSKGKFSIVTAEEILFHFGKEVIYNTFDQNRLFLGYRQKTGKYMSYDFGYMMVYQQKYSGYQYDLNHTIRLFFYYSPDLRKNGKKPLPMHDMRDE
jgi:hypothetical protein